MLFFFEAAPIALMENVAQSNLVKAIINLSNLPRQDTGVKRSYNILDGFGVIEEVRVHIDRLLDFIGYFNSNCDRPILVQELLIWRDDVEPSIGSARLAGQSNPMFGMGRVPPRGGPPSR